jgi:prepilin-type N-terminal cleavage/methylation domain-containing protein
MGPAGTGLPRAGSKAFTLVEVLAALTIGSLLVAAAVSATRALSGTRRVVDRQVQRQEAARAAIEAVVAGLRNVRRDPIRDEPIIVGTRERDGVRIDLLVIGDTRCRPEGAESDQYELSFFLGRPTGRPWTALMCRKDHAFDDQPRDGGMVMVVAEPIVGLEFAYLADGQWQEEWSALSTTPPEAVRVTVTAIDVEEGPSAGRPETTTLSTVVPIRVDLPPAKSAEESKREAEDARERGGRNK